MKAADRLIDVAAAVSDGAIVDWGRVETQAEQADQDLVRRLRLLEQIAAVHAGLPPIAAFERSLHDSLLRPSAIAGPPSADAAVRWGPLTILEKIGSGTYADVYRAVDPRLDRPVALKLLRHREASDAAAESETIEEARLLARIDHPNVVSVFGAERIDGRVGIWMAFVDGWTLEQELQDRGPLPAEELVSIGSTLCRALDAVHSAGLLHRDVKAQNVMRGRDGRVLLTDFGTGREVSQKGTTREVVGTPLYLAPEVLNGEAASVASDIYSLGVLLDHLATGSFPAAGRSLRDLQDAHARGSQVPLKERRSDLPARLASVIDRATSIALEARYASTSEFEAALLGATEARRGARRTQLAAGAVIMVLVGLAAGYFALRRQSGANIASQPLKATQLTFNPVQLPATASAISPNGQYLAYADLNGLTVKTLSNNQHLKISVPGDLIDQITWFPDSTHLLAHSDRGTWRTTVLAEPARLLSAEGRFSVSPDGQHLALTNAAGNGIRLLTADGQDLATVVSGPRLRVSKAVWSPDGRRIAYWVARLQPNGGSKPAIESCRLDGSDVTVIVPSGPFGSGGFAWSSDGRILFSRPRPGGGESGDLWEVRVDAASGKALGNPTLRWQPQDVSFGQPTLTADGKSLVFLLNRFHTNVFVADFDPKRTEMSGLREAVLADTENYPASWMPHGDALLFESNSKWNGIYRQTLDRQEPQAFLVRPKAHVFQAIISPDTTSIFYLVVEPNQSTGPVMRVPSAGGSPEALFTVALDESWIRCSRPPRNVCVVGELRGGHLQLTLFDPVEGRPLSHLSLPASTSKRTWDLSPDGTEVASLDAAGSSVRLLLADLGSQSVRAVTVNLPVNTDYLAWCADGKGWIVTTATGRRGGDVLFLDVTGRLKTLWTSDFQRLTMPMVSPDGRLIAFGSRMSESSVWRLEGF